MPSYGGESDSGYGGYGLSQEGRFGGDTSGLQGAPDIGTLGGTFSDPYGESSVTLGGQTTPQQSEANIGVNANSWGYDFNSAGMQAPGDFSLGQLFNYNTPQGLPTNEGEFAGNVGNYGFSQFASSPFAKTLRGLLGMTPFGQVANAGIDAAQGRPISQITANAIPGMPGTVARAGLQAASSPNPAASLGQSALGYGLGTLGQTVGYGIGGPIGGMLGGLAGSRAAGLTSGPSTSTTAFGGGGNLGETLAGLYTGYQGMKQAGQLGENAATTNQALQTQMASLNDMYSPNSAYAKQLEQSLARKDAASGRNSQYGPRAVELQARLAAMAPQVAHGMSSLAGSANIGNAAAQTANTNAQIARAQMLSKLFQAGKTSGFNDWASQGLSNMFSNNIPTPQQEYYPDQGMSNNIEYT